MEHHCCYWQAYQRSVICITYSDKLDKCVNIYIISYDTMIPIRLCLGVYCMVHVGSSEYKVTEDPSTGEPLCVCVCMWEWGNRKFCSHA